MKHNRGVANNGTTRLAKIRAWLGANGHRGAVLGALALLLAVVVGGVSIAATGVMRDDEVAIPEINDVSTSTPLVSPSLIDGQVVPVPSPDLPRSTFTTPVPSTSPLPGVPTPSPATTAPASPGSTQVESGPSTSNPPSVTVAPTSSVPRPADPSVPPPTTVTTTAFNRIFAVDAIDSSSDRYLPGDPRVAIKVTANDNGGFISTVSVNWMAGTAPQATDYSLASCTNTSNGRPSSSREEVFEHTFERADTYNVVVAVTSTDCAGNNSRTNYRSVTVSASGTANGADNGNGLSLGQIKPRPLNP